MITTINISRNALKNLNRAPQYIQEKFRAWLVAIHKIGLVKARKYPGWHDKPLQGNRIGQRSIRLNKQWRAIYITHNDGNIEIVTIIEVTPHAY